VSRVPRNQRNQRPSFGGNRNTGHPLSPASGQKNRF
jgi:hypothetical protein